MGLGYSYQTLRPATLIGTKNQTTKAITGNILTGAYGGAGNTATFDTEGMSKVNFGIQYALGSAETANVLHVMISTSADHINWYQQLNNAVTAGTSVITQAEYQFTGATATAPYSFYLPLDIADRHLQVAVFESGVAANFGTCYIEATISGTLH